MNKKRMKILCLIGVLAVSFIAMSSLTALGNEEAVVIQLPGEAITLSAPFEITRAVMYRDGGTIGIVVKDGTGSDFPLCLDGRIKRPTKMRLVYVKAMHPGAAGAVQVSPGSAAEHAILKILKSARIGDATPPIDKGLVATVIGELENR
jgi:hypothetical protein